MTRKLPVVPALLLALILPSAASAGTIVYFDMHRTFEVNGNLQENFTTAQWSVSGGPGSTRNHSSVIGLQLADTQGHPFERIRAQGNLFSFTSDGPADLSTSLFTSFILDGQYLADLDVLLEADDFGSAAGFLFNETTQTMIAQIILDEGLRRLQFEGILEPGVYSYSLLAEVNTGEGFHESRGRFLGDFDLREFTPVPEPATMSLFGVGLVAAAWRRRKR